MSTVRRHHIRRTRRGPRSHKRQLLQLLIHHLPRRLLHQPLLSRRTNARIESNDMDGHDTASRSTGGRNDCMNE